MITHGWTRTGIGNRTLLLASLLALGSLAGACSDDRIITTDSGTPDGAVVTDGGVSGEDAALDGATDAEVVGDACIDCDVLPPEPECGNGTCAADEDCGSCPIDCGSCPLDWTAQSSGQPGIDLNAVEFPINAAVGFAVGQGGTVIKTIDGGETWGPAASSASVASADLYGVSFVDEQTGYVVGDAISDTPTILKTTDGGAHWAALDALTNVALRAVAFVDDLTGYVVGDGGVILSTHDGGANWDAPDSPISTTEPLFGVTFVDDKTRVAVGGAGVILRTTNDGANWVEVQPLDSTQTLRDVVFLGDGVTGYAVGDGGTIFKTTNAGVNWSSLSSGSTANLRSVAFPLDDLHGHAVGDGGVILRTLDGGNSWHQEGSLTTEDLRGVAFPAYWTKGYAVGTGGTVLKRLPPWEASVVYDTEVANLVPPTLLPNADAMLRKVFVVNSRGYLFGIRPADKIALYRPVKLADVTKNRSPVGVIQDDTGLPTIFLSTSAGIGYGVDAATGVVRWRTDGDANTPDVQPLGDALVASPVAEISGTRNFAFFVTRNDAGKENKIFAVSAKTGACQWVFNGDCNGGTGTEHLGPINGAPVLNISTKRLFVTSASLNGGATVWAIDAEDAGPTKAWGKNLGDIGASPAFAFGEPTRKSIYVGTNTGRVYRLQMTDGTSCWSSGGSGCGDLQGNEQVFCTATGTRTTTTSCGTGPGIVSGFFVLTSGDHIGHLVFLTTDGYVRMIDSEGAQMWKTAAPISGATFPLVIETTGKVYLGSRDGHLHEFDVATGTETAAQQVGDGRAIVGSPTYDFLGEVIYVGTSFGKLHSFDLPL